VVRTWEDPKIIQDYLLEPNPQQIVPNIKEMIRV